VEVVLGAYAVIVMLTAISRLGVSRGNLGIAIAHALILLLLWLIARPGAGPARGLLRDIAPLLLLLGLYAALDVLSGGGAIPAHDATVLRWEEALFGGQPARDWWQQQPSHFWSAVLHAVYLSYYLLIAAPALAFLIRGDRPALRRYTRNVMCTFAVCFLIFIFWPVGGPYYQFARPTVAFVDNLPATLVYASLGTGSSFGAAFPSSHVAATTAAWISAWQGWRTLALVMLVPVVLMPIATVYTQMHYAIDALTGVLVGIGVPVLASIAEVSSSGLQGFGGD
jgi:membrane-associated phospholipid phosphatase